MSVCTVDANEGRVSPTMPSTTSTMPRTAVTSSPQYRHVGGHPPQRTIGNLLGGGSVNLRLLNCSIHGVGIAQLADVRQTGNSLHSGKFMVPHVHRLLVKPPRTKPANSTEDNQYTEH